MVARPRLNTPLVALLSVLGFNTNLPRTVHTASVRRPVARALVCDPVTGVFAVSVTPTNGAVTWTPYTSGHQSVFTVTNTGPCNETFNFSYTASGTVPGVSL